MTHDELIDAIDRQIVLAPPFALGGYTKHLHALRAVVELHKPTPDMKEGFDQCSHCLVAESYDAWYSDYPCPTIQAIEKELK